ncbi:MAG: diaminopimelate epimerase [Desulfosporosinus sp. BRH_c37]|nr:MAG: diaminopimelate epimerase [Desulfosporosinus sp. BRH_c37]
MNFDFYKYKTLENDYIVIDPNKTSLNLTKDNIIRLCHRKFGIGADGILYGPIFYDNGINLRILNSDGSEAEKSGNGVSIFSKYLVDTPYVKTKKLKIQTLGGEVSAEILDEHANIVKVDMGKVTFKSELIPVNGPEREVIKEDLQVNDNEYEVNCLSICNPHCVIPLNTISKGLVEEIGSKLENHSNFPNGIKAQLLKIINKNTIQIEIWERGVGCTLASGSGGCAAAYVAYKLNLVNNCVQVQMPGGTIQIDIQASGYVQMTGTVQSVSKGFFGKDLLT